MQYFLQVESARPASSGRVSETPPPTQGGGRASAGSRGPRAGREGRRKERPRRAALRPGCGCEEAGGPVCVGPGLQAGTGPGQEIEGPGGAGSRAALRGAAPGGPGRHAAASGAPGAPSREHAHHGAQRKPASWEKSVFVGKARTFPSLPAPRPPASLAENAWEVLGNCLPS